MRKWEVKYMVGEWLKVNNVPCWAARNQEANQGTVTTYDVVDYALPHDDVAEGDDPWFTAYTVLVQANQRARESEKTEIEARFFAFAQQFYFHKNTILRLRWGVIGGN